MNKLMLIVLLFFFGVICESATVYNVIPELLSKREEDCSISCAGVDDNCEHKCFTSHVHGIVSDLHVVCQGGYCYCGFEMADDV